MGVFNYASPIIAAAVALAAAPVVAQTPPAPAHERDYYTPAPTSPEYRAILAHIGMSEENAAQLRPRIVTHRTVTNPDSVNLRHTRLIIHASGDNGVYGYFQVLLVYDYTEPRPAVFRREWQYIWAEAHDDEDTCANGARHFRWAVNWLESQSVDPERLAPNITRDVVVLEEKARITPDAPCVGTLTGGANGPFSGM